MPAGFAEDGTGEDDDESIGTAGTNEELQAEGPAALGRGTLSNP